MYRTIPVKANFTDSETDFWVEQCKQANSLTNGAIYYARQNHFSRLEKMENSRATYWRDDDYRCAWKTYRCNTTYPELDKALKQNPHYKALAAQSAQQILKSVGESISSHNKLVDLYYRGEVNRPSLPRYRKKGGLAAVTFPRQALKFVDCSII